MIIQGLRCSEGSNIIYSKDVPIEQETKATVDKASTMP